MKRDRNTNESPDKLNRLVEGTKIIGDLTTDSNIRVDGEVVGNINCAGKVVIGETALIKGNLSCNEADVEGTIEGDLIIEALLVLREKSKISGNIATSKIEIHQGAIFLGNCEMGARKNAGANQNNGKNNKKSGDLVY
jgi:cytoskeletal protein CcmA (bactofilin family)